MPTSHPQQIQTSIWQRLYAAAKREVAPLTVGVLLGLVSGPIGFVGGYSATAGYMSSKDEAIEGESSRVSRLSKMIGLGASSAAITFALGLAFGPSGIVIGVALTVPVSSYVTGGVGKVAVEAIIDGVKRAFKPVGNIEAPSHEPTHQAPTPPKSESIRSSISAKAAALGKRIGARIFGKRARNTMSQELAVRRKAEESQDHSHR